MLTFVGIVLSLVGSVLAISPLGVGITLLGIGISVWQYREDRKRRLEIDSLEQENASCTGWTIIFGSLALLFLVLALTASRKAA